jgi:hypothetical protein
MTSAAHAAKNTFHGRNLSKRVQFSELKQHLKLGKLSGDQIRGLAKKWNSITSEEQVKSVYIIKKDARLASLVSDSPHIIKYQPGCSLYSYLKSINLLLNNEHTRKITETLFRYKYKERGFSDIVLALRKGGRAAKFIETNLPLLVLRAPIQVKAILGALHAGGKAADTIERALPELSNLTSGNLKAILDGVASSSAEHK